LPLVPRANAVVLVTVGDAFQDLIFVGLPHLPRHGQELKTTHFTSTVGGGAVITATAAARLGMATAVISGLSADAVARLRTEKVRVVNVKRASEPHAITVALSTTRDRSFVTFNGVNDWLQPRLPAAIARQRARHVHFAFAPDDCARWIRVAERLRRRGTTTSWDFGWNPALKTRAGFDQLVGSVDFVFVNENEAALYARARRPATAVEYWRRATRNTVVKLGKRGSRWIAESLDVRVAAPRVRAVDTTGAGDAFNGGFLFALLGGKPPRECLRAGNFVGAQSTLAAGGLDALPMRRELPTSLL
jgi:sugar/nucleoside kinase (ribokinase family)